jgi:hypothetical protein
MGGPEHPIQGLLGGQHQSPLGAHVLQGGGGQQPPQMPGGGMPPAPQPQMAQSMQRPTIPQPDISILERLPAREQEPEPPEPGKRQRDLLGRIFAGDALEGLSPETRERVKRDAILTAGLSILVANGQGMTLGMSRPSLGSVVASGVLAGRQAAAESAGQVMDEQARQQRLASYAEFLGDADMSSRETWEQMARIALIQGDNDVVKLSREMLAEMPDTSEAGWEFQELKGENGASFGTFLVDNDNQLRDPFTREIISQRPTLRPDRSKPVVQRNLIDPETGRLAAIAFDPDTYEMLGVIGYERPDTGIDPAERAIKLHDLGIRTAAEARAHLTSTGVYDSMGAVRVLDSFRQQHTDASGQFVAPEGTISSIDARSAATAFQNILRPGMVRESTLEEILGSAGAVARARSSVADWTQGGNVDPGAFNDVMRVYPALRRAVQAESNAIVRRYGDMLAAAGGDPRYIHDVFADEARNSTASDFLFGN